MSTFDGQVAEFPDIRVDYFRASPSSTSRPPLAYFLSHVHSDHLAGLETCKSPFIYCSPATRDILLRLEKYPHRMNFAKGILETRKQTYRHLKNLLKAIPLDTPTTIELAPGRKVKVTLLDANHCVGAVMFLIEGDGKAVLYTGDIRSERWWVESLKRNPVTIPYLPRTDGRPGRRFDTIYLDTTFVVAGREDPYRYFPSKSEGLKELLQKVAQYPKDTLFYFDAWTFGYEDVWQALSKFLDSRIHVDDYRYGLYNALANGADPKAPEAVKMIGFWCGNHFQDGCLTRQQTRLHSCEKGTGCGIWNQDFVRVTPIITRHNGVELQELGAGGGQGDLNQQHELEVSDAGIVGQLMALCASKLQGQPKLLYGVLHMLTSVINDGVKSLNLDEFDIATVGDKQSTDEEALADLDELPLDKLVPVLAKYVTKTKLRGTQTGVNEGRSTAVQFAGGAHGPPKHITFPYSRHSSYDELCLLIEAFKPKNIHPCTVDEAAWTPNSSMSFLFGQIYDTPVSFAHDQKMLKKHGVGDNGHIQGSRPGSANSTISEYATPNGGAAKNEGKVQDSRLDSRLVVENNKAAERGTQSHVSQHGSLALPPHPISNWVAPSSARPIVMTEEWQARFSGLPKGTAVQNENCRSPNAEVPSASRARRRQSGPGDYWPPVRRDHDSPVSARRKRSISTASSVDGKEEYVHNGHKYVTTSKNRPPDAVPVHELRGSPALTDEEDYTSLRLRSLPCRGVNDAVPSEWRSAARKRKRQKQPRDHGRLSPRIFKAKQEELDPESAAHSERLPQRPVSPETRRPPQRLITSTSSPVDVKVALRREAYDAVLQNDGRLWSDIGLVSVNGHQEREVEL